MILDTNALSIFIDGEPRVREILRREARAAMAMAIQTRDALVSAAAKLLDKGARTSCPALIKSTERSPHAF